MGAQKLDGRAVAAQVRAEARDDAAAFEREFGRPPALATVLVGENPASQVYVRNKIEAAREAGIAATVDHLPADLGQEALNERIAALNADERVDGVLLQLPLPAGLVADAALAVLSPDKDVDGLTESSAGRLLLGEPGLRPCTPLGCVRLAQTALGRLDGKRTVVVGRSILVGKPAALLFLEKNSTVTLAHSRTADLPAVCRDADILVPAVGRPELVRADWVKPGACVIDVGINRTPAPERGEGKTRLVGDVAFDEVSEVAGWITPVPGGVGPLTVAYLLANTVAAARARRA